MSPQLSTWPSHTWENQDTCVQMMLNFNSAFYTIIPQHLVESNSLQLDSALSDWNTSVSPKQKQYLQHHHTEGFVLGPLLFTLLIHNCTAMHSSNHIKFPDDATVVGIISKNDESASREEVKQLTALCEANNLSQNVDKTKEMLVDFRRARSEHPPLFINTPSTTPQSAGQGKELTQSSEQKTLSWQDEATSGKKAKE